MSAKVIYFPNPFTREHVEIDAIPGDTVAEALRDHCIKNNQLQLLIYRDRKHIDQSYIIGNDDEIIVHSIPKSGVANPEKFWSGVGLIGAGVLGIFLSVTMLNPLGLIGAWGMVGSGIYLLGSAGAGAAARTPDTVYSIHGSNNTAAKYSKIPILFGKHLITPPYAASGFTWVEGTYGVDQYICLLYCLGYNEMSVKNIRLGDQIIAKNTADVRDGVIATETEFDGIVTVEIAQDQTNGTPTTLYNEATNEITVNSELVYKENIILETGENCARIAIDIGCPRGLGQYNQKGNLGTAGVMVYVEYKVPYETTWTTLYYTQTFPVIGDVWYLTGATDTNARFTTGWINLPTTVNYQVRVRRASANSDLSSVLDRVDWLAMRTVKSAQYPVDANTAKKVTQLAIKIKASQALSGIVQRLSCEAEACMPQWDGAGSGAAHWTTVLATEHNPASAFLYILKGKINPRPVEDFQIDYGALEGWYFWCSAYNWECNIVLSSEMTVEDALRLVCSTGRAQLGVLDGKYRPLHDGPQVTPLHLITQRNSWGFTFQKTFQENPHALRVTFINAAKDWEVDEGTVYWDGYTSANATLFQNIELPGITSWNQAWCMARYIMASQRLRPEIFTVMMDAEALHAARWDMVRVTYDTVGWGINPGRIVSVTTVDGDVTELTVDENCPMATGTAYGVRVRTDTGVQYYSGVTTVNGNNSVLILTTPFTGDDLPKAGDLYSFGVENLESVACIILGIEMMDDLVCKLTLCEYNDAVYTADAGEVPAFTSKITKAAFFAAPAIAEKSNSVKPAIRPPSLQYVAAKEDITEPYTGLLAVETSTGDTLVYDEDTETWSIQPLEATAIAAVQGDADAAIAAAHEASIMLGVSASQVLRSRAGVLTPATITASAKYGDDNTAYAGRFEIANSTDGLTFDIDNGIPNDPAGTTYLQYTWATVDGWSANASGPLTVSGGYLQLAGNQQFIYRAGDFNGKLIKLSVTAIAADIYYIGYRTAGGTYKTQASAHTFTAGETRIIYYTIPEATSHLYIGHGTTESADIRAKFKWVYVGTGAALWYQSSANESSKVYTPPVTSLGNYVNMIRVRLYKAGGFTTIFRERVTGIMPDTSSAAIYWGPLTTAPTTGIAANDYYFDNNNVAGGGGKIRYYTGSAWVEATSGWALFATAWGQALGKGDAQAWVNTNGGTIADVTAFMNAIINNAIIQNGIVDFLATSTQVSTALCTDNATRRMDIDWDEAKQTMRSIAQEMIIELYNGKLSSYTDVGTKRIGLRHSSSSIDFVDAPSGGVEEVFASISRRDYSSGVVCSPEIGVEIPVSESIATKTLTTNMAHYTSHIYNNKLYLPSGSGTNLNIYDISLGSCSNKTLDYNANRYAVQIYNGKLYMAGSGGKTLEIYDIEADSKTAKTLPTNMSRSTVQIYNGKIYMPQSGGTTLEIYDIALDSTTTKTLPTNIQRSTSQIYNGKIYMPAGTGTTLEIYDIALDSTTTKTLPTNMSRNTSQLYNGKLYMPQYGGTTLEIYDIALDSTTTKTLPTSMYRLASVLYNGKIYMPQSGGTTLEIYDIEADSTTVKTLDNNMDRRAAQIYNGKLYMPVETAGTTMEVYTLAEFAQLGAGIIESGSNANGYYRKFSDGSMECHAVLAGATDGTGYTAKTWTYPAAFLAGTKPCCRVQADNAPATGSTTTLPDLITATTCEGISTDTTNGVAFSWHFSAIGRWK